MLDWLQTHSSALSVLTNLGILAVWLFYAQLLLNSVRRERRPRVLINQGKGEDAGAEILVANMSREAVFVQMLLAELEVEGGDRCTRPVTDVSLHPTDGAERESRRTTSQGPLGPGGYMRLGSFERIAQWASRSEGEAPRWSSLEVRVVFFYGNEYAPLAAVRRFGVRDGDEERKSLLPYSLDTQTLRSRRHRREIQRWIRAHL